VSATESSGNVVRNSTYLTLAYILQKVLSFVYFVFYSRTLDYEHTGLFVFALSFATIFGIIVDFGLNPVLIREIARAPERSQKLFSLVFGMKGVLALLGYGAMLLVSRLLGHSAVTEELLLFTGLVMVIESMSLTIYAVFRGLQNFRYEAVGTVIHQLVLIAVGTIGLVLRADVFILAIAVVCGAGANLLSATWNARRKLGLRLLPALPRQEVRWILGLAAPFFFAGVFTKIYAYIDIVLLGQLTNTGYVGWYSVAYKLTYAIQFLPIAVSNSLYPAFSQAFLANRERLRGLLEQSFVFMVSLALPIAVAVCYLAGPIITNPRLWPTYAESVPALQLSILSLPFIFVNLIGASFLNACNRQKVNTLNIGITMVVNVALNLIMIPVWKHVGASLAAVASSLVLFSLNVFWIQRIAPLRLGWLTRRLLRSLVASAVMLGALMATSALSVFTRLPVGVVVYLAVFLAVGGFPRSERAAVLQAIRRKRAPV
jgi:O-antigen/teichoic acid export membrane protein